MLFSLLLHRPGDGVAIILKLNPAGCSQPDHTFAGVVIGKELVCRAEAAGLVSPVVVVSGKENLISKVNVLPSMPENRISKSSVVVGFGSLYFSLLH